MIAGLKTIKKKDGCELANSRLDKRFGNPLKFLRLIKQDLLNGPAIKEWYTDRQNKFISPKCHNKTKYKSTLVASISEGVLRRYQQRS